MLVRANDGRARCWGPCELQECSPLARCDPAKPQLTAKSGISAGSDVHPMRVTLAMYWVGLNSPTTSELSHVVMLGMALFIRLVENAQVELPM